MKKVTFVVLHLGYGGIEKAVASLANMLCDKYQVEIISTYRIYDKPAFPIDKRVKITYLMDNKPNRKELYVAIKKLNIVNIIKEGLKSLKILFLKKKLMIKAIKAIDSDIIISTRTIHNEWLGKYGNKESLKIAWEHSHHNNDKKYIKSLISSCDNMNYLVTVSKELASFYANKLTSRTKCLNISLSLDEISSDSSSLETKEITSVGRLSKEKGYLDLIDIFEKILEKHPDWHLNIVGDGLEKEKIIDRIKEKKLQSSITMHGYQNKDNVNNILKDTSIYVMTSFTESFGLVLIEAMSFGIPCVSFDSARGATEIITNSENGFLIQHRDKQEMANKTMLLIEDNELRKKLGAKAKKASYQYSPQKVKEDWLEFLKKITK